MAIQPRTTLKSWFETGDYPTQQQFADWIDSFWHKQEAINGDNVFIGGQSLADFLNLYFYDAVPQVQSFASSTGTYEVASKRTVQRICLLSDTTQTIKIGTTAGAEDVAVVDLVAGQLYWVALPWVNQSNMPAMLHFSDMVDGVQIAVYGNKNPF